MVKHWRILQQPQWTLTQLIDDFTRELEFQTDRPARTK